MEKEIFEKKLTLLNSQRDHGLKEALFLAYKRPFDRDILDNLRKEFISIYATIAKEEGLPSISTPEDEEALKDRVPDTIANWITVLSEIFSGAETAKRIIDPVDTAAILLLKIYEWIGLNYQGRFLYGEKLEKEAEKGFYSLEAEMDLLGDKDEIISLVLENLNAFCSHFEIDKERLLPGVRHYYLEVLFNYGSGERILRIGIKSMIFDQVKFRAYCPDQHILSHIFEALANLSAIGNPNPESYI